MRGSDFSFPDYETENRDEVDDPVSEPICSPRAQEKKKKQEIKMECSIPVIAIEENEPDESCVCEPQKNTPERCAPCSMPCTKNNERNLVLKRITLSHIAGNQGSIDFSSNYSSLGILLGGNFSCGSFFPLLDLQCHRFDNTTYAATGGIVLRNIPTKSSLLQEIAGLNLYYDYRHGSIGYFQQCSFGLEILADRWEVRANGYIPFGGKIKMKTCNSENSEWDRRTSQNLLKVSYGFNGEIGGYPLKTPSLLIYLGGGPYYISGREHKTNTIGGEIRLRPQYKDFIAIDLSYNWDPLFHSVFQADLILYFPFYQLSKRKCAGDCGQGLTLRQIYQNVERFDVMPLGRRTCRRPG